MVHGALWELSDWLVISVTAEAFHCKWTAVHVATGDESRLSPQQQNDLEENMNLAEKLGARTLILHGNDVAEALAEFANMSGITNIVIGKSKKKKSIHSLWENDFEDRLISLLDKSEIHILSNNDPDGSQGRALRSFPFKRWLSWWTLSSTQTSKMLGILFVTTVISYLLKSWGVEQHNLAMIYLLAVILTSRAKDGYAYGIVASVVSVLLFDVLFVDPIFHFKTNDPSYLITFLILLIIALITSSLITSSRIQASLIVEREQRLQVLYDINRQLLRTRGLDSIVASVNDYISRSFNRPVVFYAGDERGGIPRTSDYSVLKAARGKEGMALMTSYNPDLVLLDLGLPDMDGMEVLKRIRTFSAVPVMVVSARGNEREKVEALDCGADDYVTKPFSTSELLARIRTALRHSLHQMNNPALPEGSFSVGELTIDYEKRKVTVRKNEVHLTPNEYKIVVLLSQYAGRVLTHDSITKAVWGPYMDENRTLRVNMANIHRKIEKNQAQPEYILTDIGVGYRMVEELEE